MRELEFPAYPADICLCVVDVMKEYLERTKSLRGDITSLFVTHVKPYKAASKDIISLWIKTTLGLAGIDITRFKPHSIRSSSTSAAPIAKVQVDTHSLDCWLVRTLHFCKVLQETNPKPWGIGKSFVLRKMSKSCHRTF